MKKNILLVVFMIVAILCLTSCKDRGKIQIVKTHEDITYTDISTGVTTFESVTTYWD